MVTAPTCEAQLTLEPQGRAVPVRAGQTLLDAALAAGINLPHSCKSGHCSSCRARLQGGEIVYLHGRPPGLTAQEAATGYVLLCQARAATPQVRVAARAVSLAGQGEIRQLPCRIERIVALAPDVRQLFLRLPATEEARFAPGQYLDVLLEDGRRRSFSIASPPHDSRLLELHVRRAQNGLFTARLFHELRAGALLRIELPIGQFVYRDVPGPLLLIAGGTGFAPIKSILRHVFETGRARPVQLYWGARTADDFYELDWLYEFRERHPQLAITTALSAQAATGPHVEGWVHEVVLRRFPSLTSLSVYAAGPPQMIEAIRSSFPAAGLDPDRLYFDSFDYAPTATPAA